MHLVLIGWLYVIGLVALTASSALVGITVFVLGGLAPVLLLLRLLAGRMRRRREAPAAAPPSRLEREVHDGDDRNA